MEPAKPMKPMKPIKPMKRFLKYAHALLLILGLTALEAGAQSIADVARQQRAERSQRGQTGPLIDTETAASSRSVITIAGTVVPIGVEEAPSEAAPAEPGAESEGAVLANLAEQLGNDEQSWRAAFAEARADIQRVQDRIALNTEELKTLNYQLQNRTDIYDREHQIPPLIAAKQEEIAAGQRELADANQALADLQTALRRANLPAGWGR